LQSDELELWRAAGQLACRARDFGAELLVPGARLREVAERIEGLIYDGGGAPAFPVNFALDDVAAHWTPSPRSLARLERGTLVKLDVGAHIDGHIGDTAVTVEVGSDNYHQMRDASREALEVVINLAAPGVNTGLLGEAVQQTIERHGFHPIANLTGHGIRRFNLHTGISIPNVAERGGTVLKRDDIIAVEPFATDGAGRVGGRRNSNIYRLQRARRVKDSAAQELIEVIRDRYRGLPFSERDLMRYHEAPREPLHYLLRRRVVQFYPILEELGRGKVTQHEHTLLVTGGGVEVLTR